MNVVVKSLPEFVKVLPPDIHGEIHELEVDEHEDLSPLQHSDSAQTQE